jgi:ribosomal protein S18 acetylase RimI-like enzyme
MSHDILIEDARPEDRERIAQLFAADLETLRLHQDREQLLQVIDEVLKDGCHNALFWVARTGPGEPPVGVLLATALMSVKHGGRSLWLEQLYVDPAGRKLGIGRALVQRLLRHARQEGLVGIDLESYQLNAPASCLYRSLGFRRLGRERFTIDLINLKDA